MKLIIDMDNDIIEGAKSSPNYYPIYHFEKIWRAIVNGTPLKDYDVLDKIKEEIEQIEINGYIRDIECFTAGINTALNVINKYRNEVSKE